jgi:ubiquitin-protein ligase E3 A
MMIRFDVLIIIILQDGFTSESTAVIHLWKILNEFNEDEKKMFLKFVTGRLVRKFISQRTIHTFNLLLLHFHHLQHSDRSPIDGLSKLAFVVSKNGTEDQRLPSAHTCFNHLLLPAYSTLEIMRCKIRYAMTQSEGFGLR